MTIKSILCIFRGFQNELNALNTAMILGKANNAHIKILHISRDAAAYAALGYGDVFATASLVEVCEKENKEHFETAKQHAISFAAKHHIPLDISGGVAQQASAQFIHVTGYVDSIVTQEGRLTDLIIIGQGSSEHNKFKNSTVSAALFNTGRPVLLIPKAKGAMASHWEDKIVSMAWDGSLEASRTLFNAFPLISKTKNFHLIFAQEQDKALDLEAQQGMMQYLHEHDLNSDAIIIDKQRESAAEVILAKSKVLKSNLLIMGAYEHSRLREMILGGVTNYMLEKADVPLLLSH